MPELPEVEAVAISLRPLVVKRRIRSVEVFHPITVLPQSAAHVSKVLTGRRIESVQRKGKYLFLVLDNNAAIEMHFRFDGHLIRMANAKEVNAAQTRKPTRVCTSTSLSNSTRE
jgi:formamidopyrimidine-DNA glycosylase